MYIIEMVWDSKTYYYTGFDYEEALEVYQNLTKYDNYNLSLKEEC